MRTVRVTTGVYWVEIPEVHMQILCGCPADAVKHLMKRGLIVPLEENGVKFESGPNAILLSDVAMQNEQFCNLGEFPVLQMLYRQGMILPNHPNNTGRRPMIIGNASQLKAQSEYIFRGNYGLSTQEELEGAGLSSEEARALMRMKLRFAFDSIKTTAELLDLRIVGKGETELRDGVYVKRLRPNYFEIGYRGPGDGENRTGASSGAAENSRRHVSVTVDLNLPPGREYEAPYNLGYHELRPSYFSVVHSGDADGWDPDRPCMASIISFQGKIYLVDAGPNILSTLTSLGLSANNIEGIFQSHAHDDHFAGLPVLMRGDHRIKYYATRLVRTSVSKKLTALLSLPEGHFERCFEVHDLPMDEWTDIEGLEVRPVLSAHPIETTIFFIRTLWERGYRTYAHLADIASFENMKMMVTDDVEQTGISAEMYKRFKQEYLTVVDVKKVDVGGGMIHGRAGDFAVDKSPKIILSHTGVPLSDREKEIGESASFGMAEVLVPTQDDLVRMNSLTALRSHFPNAATHELRMLLNCQVRSFNPGRRIIRSGEKNGEIYFILSGLLEFIDSAHGIHSTLSAGAMAGELSGVLGTAAHGTYRTISPAKVLRIPANLYRELLAGSGRLEAVRANARLRRFIQSTWLFGNMVSAPVINRVMEQLKVHEWERGKHIVPRGKPALFLVHKGGIRVSLRGRALAVAGPGNFFGSEIILFGKRCRLSGQTTRRSTIYEIPAETIADVPIIQWKLLAAYEQRMCTADVAAEQAPALGPHHGAAVRTNAYRG